MVERQHYYGRLVFDRDAIVRAALRAYVETNLANLDPRKRHRFAVAFRAVWTGDLQRGAFNNDDACGDYEVVAWNEAGVVGLAYSLGCGPIEQLDLEIDAVTGGPDDVRGAVLGLPAELESAFVMAVGTLYTAKMHQGEKLAGVGFWLHGDKTGGSFFQFEDPTLAWGATRLAAWGLLQGDRLPRAHSRSVDKVRFAPEAAPIHAIVDAVTARALVGPTELTRDEFATLCPMPPNPQHLLHTQQALQKVGITLPVLAASP
jgi:hypothetical protein